jgi:predicted negative regulator of RcsB-dependent stress response
VSPEIKAGEYAASDLHARSDLSAKLQGVPSLQAYGYTMQGDVLWAQGHVTAAKKAYQNASAIQSTPVTEKKLEAVKVTELKQGH